MTEDGAEFFDQEMTRAIVDRGVQYRSIHKSSDPGMFWVLKYLRKQVLTSRHRKIWFIATIQSSLEALISHQNSATHEDIWGHATNLSEAAIHYLQSNSVFEQFYPDYERPPYYPCPQSPACPEHLLSVAAYVGNTLLVKQLLQQDINCNTGSDVFGKPLQCAVFRGNNDVAALLLDAGADPNGNKAPGTRVDQLSQACPNHGEKKWHFSVVPDTPFQWACYAGNWDAMKSLLQSHFGIPTSGPDFANAVLSAIRGGHSDIFHFLLDLGDLDITPAELLQSFWESALIRACKNGTTGVVNTILDQGISPDGFHKSYYGAYLAFAAAYGYEDIVRILLKRGANPLRRGYFGHPTQRAAEAGFANIIQLYIDLGIHLFPNVVLPAVYAGQDHVIRLLVKNGITLSGEGIYKTAVHQGYESTASLILELGIDPETKGA
ncbi:hypothetical protein PRK78_004744 [Emydomyces testavorans]|uniref:Ankyrin n=1 Tax=Emydomyces testavorans TaxID=2070801 RepID=A0AAF0IIW1_9EURO|nr:hypothetical protein PRK78_004744 [Emydomyces testavorans]